MDYMYDKTDLYLIFHCQTPKLCHRMCMYLHTYVPIKLTYIFIMHRPTNQHKNHHNINKYIHTYIHMYVRENNFLIEQPEKCSKRDKRTGGAANSTYVACITI